MVSQHTPPWSLARRERFAVLALIILVILFYGIGYWVSLERPSLNNPGWWGWFDQGQYYRSIVALERSDYSPTEHLYPVGYPLIGSLFYPIMPDHPFFIPDLACYLVICLAFLWICEKSFVPEEALLLCFFALIVPSTVRINLIRPWTDAPAQASLMVLTYLALSGRRDRVAGIVTGACAGIVFMTRPGDLLYCWPVITVLWFGARGRRELWQRATWLLTGALPLVAVESYFSLAIHGNLVSEAYRKATAIVGFGFASPGLKLYTLLIDGYPLFGEPRTLVKTFPVLLFTLPGVVVFIKKFKWSGLAVVATQAGALLYFMAYNDFWISNVFKNGGIRHWLWIIPFLFLYAYMSLRVAWWKLGWIATGLLIAAPVLAWTLPQMTILPLMSQVTPGNAPSAGGWECKPNPDGSCGMSVELAEPAQFDILELTGIPSLKLMSATFWIDKEKSRMFRDHILGDAPDGRVYVVFFSPKRGRSVQVLIPPGDANGGLLLSDVQLAMRHTDAALRNPFQRYHPRISENGHLTSFSQEITSPINEFHVKAGGTYPLEITVMNTGTESWLRGTRPTSVEAGYRWRDGKGTILPMEGTRAMLNRAAVRPGESDVLHLQVAAPPAPGSYTLCVSMVQEGVSWFMDQGAKPLLLPVTVE